jgi:O-methyltransferase
VPRVRTAETKERPQDLNPTRAQVLLTQAKNLVPTRAELEAPARYVPNVRFVTRLRRERYTMLSPRRARNLAVLSAKVESEGVPGAIVDCGVWNGGSTIILGRGAPSREVWAFDSFEGLPPPGERDPDAHEDWTGELEGSEEKLREGFARYAGNAERLHTVKGWFNETFPKVGPEIDQIALIHIDADWYESCRDAFETFYDKVSPGGYVVVDDLRMWQGAREATDDFRAERGITAPLMSAHYWRKD